MATIRSRRSAFTLPEMMVVVGILAVLMALLMSAVQKGRETAQRVSTMNNLHNLGLALNNHLLMKKAFPTETGTNDSFYKSILPYVEQTNATDTTAVKLYISPSRGRSTELGPKRDFGYAASTALGTVGPSVLDSLQPVSGQDVTIGGKQSIDTALLTLVWMAPKTYLGGDATDTKWSDKQNARSNLGAIKHDHDPSANNTFLGGPYESGIPVLFVDSSVRMVPYGTSANDWAYMWAYNTKMTRSCNGWADTGGAAITQYNKVCKDCKGSCRCGCIPPDQQFTIGGNVYGKDEVIDLLKKAMQDGYLTATEADLLRRLSPTDYNKYLQLNQQWKQATIAKATKGETLTTEEQTYYNRYLADQARAAEYARLREEQAKRYAWEQEALNLGKTGQTMTAEQKAFFDQWTKQQADAKAAADAWAAQQKFQQDAIAKGTAGQTMTAQEKAYYDQYVLQQAQYAAQQKAQQEAYQKQLQQYQWEQTTLQKVKTGQSLTYEEQKYYTSYLQQQQNAQQYQQQQQLAYQQQLQQQLGGYIGSIGGMPAQTGSGGPCSCGFTCCGASCRCSQ